MVVKVLLCGFYSILGGCLLAQVRRAHAKISVVFWSLKMADFDDSEYDCLQTIVIRDRLRAKVLS